MIRLVAILGVLCAVVAGAFFAIRAVWFDKDGPQYTVVLDNAFGLIEGADVKVAGVRGGQITKFEIDRKTYRARVGIRIDQKGFGDLREDVFCESRPQSLIGEYFLDCKPGTGRKLKRGAVIPVERTGSTVPVDLVNNIMRRPYRERFSIILGELGAALTSRGEDLNETIRRANPALRETDKVLAQLAEQRRVIRDLTTNAERVVGRLDEGRKEVTRFVREARDTAAASADRRQALRGQVQRLPTFLDELRPTMARLGEAADAQVPALTNLSNAAPQLERFFATLGPFSEASRPAFRTLAKASRAGRPAVRASRPRIGELRAFVDDLPELSSNLAITVEHLHDRKFAVEKDPESPGGEGFTGFEAILQYVFRQSQAVNLYDGNSYLLKVSGFIDNLCAQYTSAEQARAPERRRCRANLGPNQPGVDQPDPSKGQPGAGTDGTPAQARRGTERDGEDRDRDGEDRDRERADGGDGGDGGRGGEGGGDDVVGGGDSAPLGPGDPIPPVVEDLLDDLGAPDAPQAPALPGRSSDPGLLDYLLGP